MEHIRGVVYTSISAADKLIHKSRRNLEIIRE
jgi:hypothetical protein